MLLLLQECYDYYCCYLQSTFAPTCLERTFPWHYAWFNVAVLLLCCVYTHWSSSSAMGKLLLAFGLMWLLTQALPPSCFMCCISGSVQQSMLQDLTLEMCVPIFRCRLAHRMQRNTPSEYDAQRGSALLNECTVVYFCNGKCAYSLPCNQHICRCQATCRAHSACGHVFPGSLWIASDAFGLSRIYGKKEREK